MLQELNNIIDALEIPVETGEFTGNPPPIYVVVTPISDEFEVYADNKPTNETQEVRVSLFVFGNYIDTKNKITKAILDTDFTITDRKYVGFDKETGYHNYAIDVAKEYSLDKEDN
jgi:hypothetical protein